jgi:hypothetical protein
MIDASEFPTSKDALIAYSIFAPENTNGKFLLLLAQTKSSIEIH